MSIVHGIRGGGIGGIVSPSNKGMELTIKSVTPFAWAKAAPLLLAAHARC